MSEEVGDSGRTEELRERDKRIQNTMIDAIRDYIENLPRQVAQYDDQGRIIDVHPVRFDGTEFPIRTRRGAFAVSIYPVPFRRTEEEPPRG